MGIKILKQCFFDNINIKDFDQNIVKIDEKSYENLFVYCNGYFAVKDSKYVKLNSLIPLYLIIIKTNEYFEKNILKNYLVFHPTNELKRVIKNTKNFGVTSQI